MISADNQQERLGYYVSGFVDGEGSFHVAIQRNKTALFGYQLVPELHVSNNDTKVLKLMKKLLGCGYIKDNHKLNPRDFSSVFVVRNRRDLLTKIIPFFETYPLISLKAKDFEKFAFIVKEMEIGTHLKKDEFLKLLKSAFSMNANGKHRKFKLEEVISNLESSETIRQTPRCSEKI